MKLKIGELRKWEVPIKDGLYKNCQYFIIVGLYETKKLNPNKYDDGRTVKLKYIHGDSRSDVLNFTYLYVQNNSILINEE